MNQSISEEVGTIEERIKNFGNRLAVQLNPSNDTMEAVRLIRKELPSFIDEALTAERKELRERIGKYDIVPPQVKMENPYYWEGCQYAVKKIISLLEEK